MKIKRILALLAGIVLIVLVITFIQFTKLSKVENEETSNSKDAICVLAPYESKIYQRVLNELGEQYSEEGGKQVQFEFIPEENMKKELLLRQLNKKDNIDMVICANTLMPELIKMGFFRELSIDQNTHQRVRRQTLWNSVKENGKTYGVPFTCDPYVLFYRKDRMEEKNLACPTTWEEFEYCGKTMQKRGIKSIGIPGKRVDDLACIFRIMLYSSGGNFLSLDQKSGVQTFEQIQRMARQNLLDREMINYTSADLAWEFAEGKITMMINQMSAASVLRESDMADKIGVARLPNDVAGSVFLYGENIGVLKSADSTTEEFLKFLIRKENTEKLMNATGSLSPYIDTVRETQEKVYLEDWETFFQDARVMEIYVTWTKMSEDIAQGLYELVESYQADAEKIAVEVYDKVKISIMQG